MKHFKKYLFSTLILVSSAQGQEPVATSSGSGVSTDELRYAQLMMGELDEQLQIANAKMDSEAIDRKRAIGRRKALSKVADEQQRLLAAQTQQAAERHQRLSDQLRSLAEVEKSQGVATDEYNELIAASQEKLDRLRARLDKVTRQKAMLDANVGQLKRNHVRSLLKSAVTEPSVQVTDFQKGSLENLLDREAPVDESKGPQK